jgi:hypothetical protein
MMKLKSGTARQAGKLTPNEFLILALIWGGHANTLYTLQKKTLLSAGALVPALLKLKAKRLLELDAKGPRKRQEFRVSEGAMAKIKKQWYSRDHVADCDAVLKLCKAGQVIDIASTVEYAAGCVGYRDAELRKYTNQAGVVEAPKVDVFSYRSYTDVARFYRLLAELKTLEAVSAALNTEYWGREDERKARNTGAK